MIPNVTDELRNQSLKYHLIQTLFCSRPLRIFHCGSWVFQSFNFLAFDSGEVWLSIIRSSRPEVFCKKDALKNFLKFTGKYLCQSLFSNKFAGLRLLAKYVENFLPKRWYKQNNFFYFTDGWNSYFKWLINNYVTLKSPFFNTSPPFSHTSHHHASSRMITRLPLCYVTTNTDTPFIIFSLFWRWKKNPKIRILPWHIHSCFKQLSQIVRFK